MTEVTESPCGADTRIARNPDLVAAQMDGDIVMLNVCKGHYYGINPMGAQLWQWLEQPRSLGELAVDMAREYEVDLPTAQADLQRFVARLLQEELVQIV